MASSLPVTSAGVYEAVDLQKLKLLTERQDQMISENRERMEKLIRHQEEYQTLKARLQTIADKTHYSVMVPFGKKAFMSGHLVHTNEIMVLLGDNYFTERSAKQACDIIDRRLASCKEKIDKLKEEAKLLQNWKKETHELKPASVDDNVEIREPFDEETEKKWRDEHRKRMSQYRKQEKDQKGESKSDEELWRRLDELELEEELDQHLASEARVKVTQIVAEESDISSPDLSDDEDGRSSNRRVSFGSITEHMFEADDDDEEEEEEEETDENLEPQAEGGVKVIEISHRPKAADDGKKIDFHMNPELLSPRDLEKHFIQPSTPTKSILKPFDSNAIRVIPQPDSEETTKPPFVNPVSEEVVEKRFSVTPVTPSDELTQPPKKESRFKQMRQKKQP